MKIKIIKFSKIKISFTKLPKKFAESAFLTFLGLLLLFLFFGAVLFYKYIFLAQKVGPETLESLIKLDEKSFQEVLLKIAEREQKFKATEFKQYPDPFLKPVVIEKPPAEIPVAPLEGGELTPAP